MQTSARASTGNEMLDADIDELEASTGFPIELLRDGQAVGVVLKDVVLPSHFNREYVDILMRTTISYPHEEMDMFWVDDIDLKLAPGNAAQGADSIEQHFDRAWLRFSWHRNMDWQPGRDTLLSHFEMVRARLAKPQ